MVVRVQDFEWTQFGVRIRKSEQESTGQIIKLSFIRKIYNEDKYEDEGKDKDEDEGEGENYVFDYLVKEAYCMWPLAFG